MTDQNCFLEHESWRNLQLIDYDRDDIPTDCVLHHEGLNYFAQVPGIVRRIKGLKYSGGSGHPDSQILQSTASQLRSNMLDWYIKKGIVSKRTLQTLSIDSNTPTSYYHYDSSTTASFAVNHCAFLILINKSLDLLSGFSSHHDANRDLATEISLSARYCLNTGFCGTQALMQALPIALTAVPEGHPTHESLQKWLKLLNETNLAIKWNANLPKNLKE